MTRFALASLVALAACSATEGDVLTQIERDASVGVLDDGGLPVDGGVLPCAIDGPCPTPSPGDLTVCGRVIDLQTSELVNVPELRVSLFDLVDITNDPPGADPFAVIEPDECGWFVAEDIEGLLPGFVVVSTDDTNLLGGAYTRVISLVRASTGQAVRTNAYAMRATTDQAWSQAAGIGESFARQGAFAAMFIDITEAAVGPFQGAPVAGVDLTGTGAPQKFYFSDASPLTRSAIDTGATATGANGAGVLLDAVLGLPYSGDKTGCDFDEVIAVTVPNVVQAQEIIGTCN